MDCPADPPAFGTQKAPQHRPGGRDAPAPAVSSRKQPVGWSPDSTPLVCETTLGKCPRRPLATPVLTSSSADGCGGGASPPMSKLPQQALGASQIQTDRSCTGCWPWGPRRRCASGVQPSLARYSQRQRPSGAMSRQRQEEKGNRKRIGDAWPKITRSSTRRKRCGATRGPRVERSTPIAGALLRLPKLPPVLDEAHEGEIALHGCILSLHGQHNCNSPVTVAAR